jgi:hypothetical protein
VLNCQGGSAAPAAASAAGSCSDPLAVPWRPSLLAT